LCISVAAFHPQVQQIILNDLLPTVTKYKNMCFLFYRLNPSFSKPNFILVVVALILQPFAMMACECKKVSYRFMDGISKSEFVAMVEIVGELDSINAFVSGYSFTKVKIINQFAGDFIGNETYLIGAQGHECYTSLMYNNIGDKFMIKGYYSEGKDYINWYSCSANILNVKNDEVIGWVNIYRGRHWWKWTAFLKAISFGLIERDIQKYHPKPQQMKIENFISLLNKELKRS
jgi:hypothetical protein